MFFTFLLKVVVGTWVYFVSFEGKLNPIQRHAEERLKKYSELMLLTHLASLLMVYYVNILLIFEFLDLAVALQEKGQSHLLSGNLENLVPFQSCKVESLSWQMRETILSDHTSCKHSS